MKIPILMLVGTAALVAQPLVAQPLVAQPLAAQPLVLQPAEYQPQAPAIEAARERLTRENPERFEARTLPHQGRTIRYRWFAPEKADAPLPLVVVLHGSSGKGTDNTAQILSGTGALGAGVWATPGRQKEHPCFVLVPQCPPGQMWTHTASWTSATHPYAAEPTRALADVMVLLDDLLGKHRIDPARLYLVGASMGGYGTFEWIVREPARFAAAIPICGGMPEGQAAKLKDLPLWIFHGEDDPIVPIVPIAESRRAFAEITAAGGRPRLTEYARGGHNISVHAWSDPAVARWLFSQRATETN